jgi:sulfur carrier protein
MSKPSQAARSAVDIQFALNGKSHACVDGTSIATLLSDLNYADKRVAIERNGGIVPKSQHAQTLIAEGDQLEIVQAIGGG